MDALKPVRVKFKLEDKVIEELIEKQWSIGKIKGIIRKKFKINPYYMFQLLYEGRILENELKFKDIGYKQETFIKV